MKKNNIVLIGMPGAGKSTIGVVLAKQLGFQFLDSDICIQQETGRLLHELIDQEGLEGFLAIENRVNASLSCKNHVIATGGSVIYGKEAMEHLRTLGEIVYLRLPLDDLVNRLGDLCKRGVALKEHQTLQDLYEERVPYYEQYADYTIDTNHQSIRECVLEISQHYRNKS